MSRQIRAHAAPIADEDAYTPKHLTKQEFGRRLYKLMLDNGWNQSELARRAGIGRDAVSTYIRGRSFPEPKNLAALAEVFGVTPRELMPNTIESAIDADIPALEIKQSAGHPGHVWMRVNQLVTFGQASQIFEILKNKHMAQEDE